MKKLLTIALMLVLILSLASNIVFAAGDDDDADADAGTTAGIIDPSTIKGKGGTGANSVKDLGQQILGIVQTVGSIAAVIILVVLGIKYMMGSAEEKAEYKKTLIPYIVGAVLIFAASNIAGFIYDWAITIK